LSATCRAGRSGAFGSVWPILCYSFDSLDLHRDRDTGEMHFTDLGLDPPVNAQTVVGDRFAPSCTTLGDNGALVDKVISSSLAKPSSEWKCYRITCTEILVEEPNFTFPIAQFVTIISNGGKNMLQDITPLRNSLQDTDN
jgi:hypothetical protein